MTDYRARARLWTESDPEPKYRAEVEGLLAADSPELAELFTGRLAFGTAGLRAALGPGPNRMNRRVVRETTAGLMRWLAGADLGHRNPPLVVIGYDARHGSAEFATDVAAVVGALGGRAEMLPRPLPTPVLAAAVLHLGADAGVMITASHNPPQDNGYKLYLGDGIQLVPPADGEIAASIDDVAADPAMVEQLGDPLLAHAPDPIVLGEEVVQHHLDLAVSALTIDARSLGCVYTAMHGVGGEHLLRAFAQAGFPPPHVVAEQFDPDPDFPTVPFPNPEESGALDLALAKAAAVGADLVLANDPDADRLAVAVPARTSPTSAGRYVALSGDQLGVLLADHLLRVRPGPNRQVAMSLVSSRLMGAMAESEGVRCTTTLTGFKWVARPIIERPDLRYLLGYEEAIGYSVGGLVRDKDGISAALVAAEMVADAKQRGETLWDRLDRLAVSHGLYRTAPLSVRLPGADGMARRAALLAGLLADPPRQVGEATLTETIDLEVGGDLPPTEGLVLEYDDRTRVIVRPSGTEPKLKAYFEVIVPVAGVESLPAAESTATDRLAEFTAAFGARLAAPVEAHTPQ